MESQLYRIHRTFGYKVEDGLYECLLPCGQKRGLQVPDDYEPQASNTYWFCSNPRLATEREIEAFKQWWCECTKCGPFIQIKSYLYYAHEVTRRLEDDFYLVDYFRIEKEIAEKICSVCNT